MRMDVELGIAGAISVALGIGHETLGLIWILPALTTESLPATPFGPPSMTRVMVHVTWHIVTIFALGMGGILWSLASSADVEPRTVLLRWFAAMWLIATVMAVWVAGRRVRNLRAILRLPVPLVWVVVAVLCWTAS
jgi:hypothetical protein